MKILVVSQHFWPENFRVNTLCTELVRRGHDVTVLTGYPEYPIGRLYDGYAFDKPYDREWNGVHIHRVRVQPRGRGMAGMLLNCLTYVTEGTKWVGRCKEKFDVIYVFGTSPVTVALPAMAYKKKFGVPIYYNVQDLWPENVEVVLGIRNKLILGAIDILVDRIYAASDRILCSSRSFVEHIGKRSSARGRLVYWPQFCEEPDFSGTEKPACYSGGHFNVVFAGNLGNAQGLDFLVEAADRLRDTGIRWFLVGDGRARERLEKRVSDAKLEDRVIFLGRMPEAEANRYIHYADCAYLSFQNNDLFNMTLPAKLQSYLACGTPILAVAGGESARAVREAGCGFVSGHDLDQLEALVRNEVLVSQQLEIMGKNGRAYFERHFTMPMVIGDLETMLEEEIRR